MLTPNSQLIPPADDDGDQHPFEEDCQQPAHQQSCRRERAEVHLLERAAVDLFEQIAHQLEDGEVEERNGQERQQRGQHQRPLDRTVANDKL
jgi:hypothetical protein